MCANKLEVNYDDKKKIWKSDYYLYGDFTNRSVGEAFLESMRRLDPYMVLEYHYDDEKELLVKDVYQKSIKVALCLQRLGIRQGDIVLLYSGNNDMISALTFGTIMAGGVVNYFDLKLNEENMMKLIFLIQPFMILFENIYFDRVLKALAKKKPSSIMHVMPLDHSIYNPNFQCELLEHKDFVDFDNFQPVPVANPQKEVAFLVLTSGTTDIPKVTQLTHTLLLNSAYIWWENDFNYATPNGNSILFSLSPLRWISQVGLVLQSSLFGIKRVCANNAATGAYGLEIICETQPTHIFAVPSFFYDILLKVEEGDEESLESLKYIQLGGEHPSKYIISLAHKTAVKSRVFYSYGMSEVAGSITNDEFIAGGKLQPGYEMQVLDENLQPLGPNQYGYLAIKTPYPFVGYKGLDNSQYILDSGFFLNGDYGYFDYENILHVLGRTKDIIKTKTKKLIPSIVESLVLGLPDIFSVCLVGFKPTPEDHYELAALFVCLNPDATCRTDEMYVKIREIFETKLDVDKTVIRDIYFTKLFPLTSCGKIDREALKEYAIEEERSLIN